MIYCPDSKFTLPLHLRQQIADANMAPHRTAKEQHPDPVDAAWSWMMDFVDEHEWKEFARGDDLISDDAWKDIKNASSADPSEGE